MDVFEELKNISSYDKNITICTVIQDGVLKNVRVVDKKTHKELTIDTKDCTEEEMILTIKDFIFELSYVEEEIHNIILEFIEKYGNEWDKDIQSKCWYRFRTIFPLDRVSLVNILKEYGYSYHYGETDIMGWKTIIIDLK